MEFEDGEANGKSVSRPQAAITAHSLTVDPCSECGMIITDCVAVVIRPKDTVTLVDKVVGSLNISTNSATDDDRKLANFTLPLLRARDAIQAL